MPRHKASSGGRKPPVRYECGLPGHRQSQCYEKARRGTHRVTLRDDTSSGSCYMVNVVTDRQPACKIPAEINDAHVDFVLDTGAAMTAVSTQIWKQMGSPALKGTDTGMKEYSGTPLDIKGVCQVVVGYEGRREILSVHVLNRRAPALWGRDAVEAFEMDLGPVYRKGVDSVSPMAIKALAREVKNVLEEYSDLFKKELSKCTVAKATLEFKGDSPVPTDFWARPVAGSLRPRVDDGPDQMVEGGCSKPVDHTEWATPSVVRREANGRVRLCGDVKLTVIQELDINQYPLPEPGNCSHMSNEGENISKIDIRDAYMPVEKFLWEGEHKNAIVRVKKCLTEVGALALCDPTVPVMLATDASECGIEAVTCHKYLNGKKKVIACAFRSLTTERKDAQIEKESLGNRRTEEFGDTDGLSRLPEKSERPSLTMVKWWLNKLQ